MQSIEKNPNLIADFSLIELTEIIVKNQGLHESLYNLSVQFQIAVGAVGPSPELIGPGAMVGISRIGLSKTEEENIHTVNAAEVNPAPKKRSRKTKT
jgi:hypothetical protein